MLLAGKPYVFKKLPHYYLVAESGQLNTLVHGWVYDSASDREQKRARMMADPTSPRCPATYILSLLSMVRFLLSYSLGWATV